MTQIRVIEDSDEEYDEETYEEVKKLPKTKE